MTEYNYPTLDELNEAILRDTDQCGWTAASALSAEIKRVAEELALLRSVADSAEEVDFLADGPVGKAIVRRTEEYLSRFKALGALARGVCEKGAEEMVSYAIRGNAEVAKIERVVDQLLLRDEVQSVIDRADEEHERETMGDIVDDVPGEWRGE